MRSRVAAEIRHDLAEEATAGFPLLRRFPDTEMAGVPAFVAGLTTEERASLLDGLVEHATREWSYQHGEAQTQAFPVLARLKRLQPVYPEGDWYAARPKKTKLKKAFLEGLVAAGFARLKREAPSSPDWLEFAHPDSAFLGRLTLFFDPGFPRQIDYGYRGWLRPELLRLFPPLGPRKIVPALSGLNYEVLWRRGANSNGYCWDVITEANLAETVGLLVETLERLAALARRINALEV